LEKKRKPKNVYLIEIVVVSGMLAMGIVGEVGPGEVGEDEDAEAVVDTVRWGNSRTNMFKILIASSFVFTVKLFTRVELLCWLCRVASGPPPAIGVPGSDDGIAPPSPAVDDALANVCAVVTNEADDDGGVEGTTLVFLFSMSSVFKPDEIDSYCCERMVPNDGTFLILSMTTPDALGVDKMTGFGCCCAGEVSAELTVVFALALVPGELECRELGEPVSIPTATPPIELFS
jgi:hypothetical protein